ncbi:MAG TPA: zinc-dependent alcohol dehydrogenase family protein [Chryseolinea sp.]
MKAMILKKTCDLHENSLPLELVELPNPVPTGTEILVKISCCGVCHTELDEIEGRTPPRYFPMILGHQVIGHVVELGHAARKFKLGQRIGIAWIFSACGRCDFCERGMENLCREFEATGRDARGGYAEFLCADESFAYAIPEIFSDAEASPLLCAGAVGFRSLRLTNIHDGQTLALTGFGASGHLVLKMTQYLFPKTRILVFARNPLEQDFAKSLGAFWAGNFTSCPEKADAIIDTTPAWMPVAASLLHLKPGGRLVINAIRKENADKAALLEINYHDHIWMEKEIKSVANITRRDVEEFLQLAARIPIKPEIETYPLERANEALLDLKHKHVKGAKVLLIGKY